ncbi:hypothetical protein [Actinokineospora cianjurensis]|uniref:Uncharacterized protein n=1 Tax=Actinokineospora cianjurensis TaxID=585224 RepID=A0A421B378_9PSEU|nr:hypothetical protein [Actinokineospora cianjurensis]RLK58841.1 hypothetical protein CLV68_3321 [Actinokineospora cianjurensis]
MRQDVDEPEITVGRVVRRGCAVWLLLAAAGTVFAAFSLPEGTARLTARDGWGWLHWLADTSAAVNAALPAFPLLLTCLVWATGAFLVGVLLLAVRHRRPAFAAIGLLVVPIAAAGLHAVAWVGAAVHWAIVTVLPWFRGWDWWVWVLVVGAGVLVLVVLMTWEDIPDGLAITCWLLLWAGYLLVGVGLLLLVPYWVWTVDFLPLRVLAALVVLHMLGALVIDQLTGTTQAGRGTLGVLSGAIGVGTSWATLLVVSNAWGSHNLYPPIAREWVAGTLLSNNPPQFDALVTLLVVAASTFSVSRNVIRMRAEPTYEQFATSVVYTLYGMAFSTIIASLGHTTETGNRRT